MDIKVNGIKIHYEVLGEGKPIILLNPNTTNTNSMKFIANKLSKDFKVYLMDRRCCGKSERNCELTYEESAKDVYEFIQALKLDKPYVLGSSGGATVALTLAINYPECISKLVVCSGVTKMSSIAKPGYVKILEKLPIYPGKKTVEMFENLNNSMRDITKEDLEKIVVPTLVVNGGKKDVVPMTEAKFIAENVKVSKLLILENERHYSYLVNCKWYNKLKEFLNEGE